MAKIIYGVSGQGFGHSCRSHLIGQKLINAGNDVLFAASGKSLRYLRQYFPDRVVELSMMSLVYEAGQIRPFKTVAANITEFLKAGHSRNLQTYRHHFLPFEHDLVITDFEPFTAWWAWRNRVPYISIDHQHLLTNYILDSECGTWVHRFNACVVINCYYFSPAAHIVLNFFNAPAKRANTIIAPPVVRPIVTSTRPARKDHITVYSTDLSARETLLETLSIFPDNRFFIYGFNESLKHRNCTFKKTSTDGFIKDLAACKGVIATAGFSLISECLHFRKRMLLLPIQGQYEQMINAHYIQKLDLGLSAPRLDEKLLDTFLRSLDDKFDHSRKILWPENNKFFQALDTCMRNTLHPARRQKTCLKT